MEKYLLEILQNVNTIIIPGFGALTITNHDTGEIMFMSYLKHDDGKLVSYIMENEGLGELEAKNLVAKYVREIEMTLNDVGFYEIMELGTFYKNGDEIDFNNWGVIEDEIKSGSKKDRKIKIIRNDHEESEQELTGREKRESLRALREDSNIGFFKDFKGSYWWLNAAEEFFPSNGIEIGYEFDYLKFTGSDDRLRSNFSNLQIGDIAISYQKDPSRRLFGIFQIVNIDDKNVRFRFVHELPKKIKWNELTKIDWFRQTQIAKMQANGSIFPLTYVQFIALIQLSSSVFDVAEHINRYGFGFNAPFKREKRTLSFKEEATWWYNNNSPIIDLSNLKVGDIHVVGSNGKTGRRSIYENFFDVRIGDTVLGYQGFNLKSAVCIMTVTQKIDDDFGGELVFEVSKILDSHIEWNLIALLSSLSNSELLNNPDADLVKLTSQQFDDILSLSNSNGQSNPEATDERFTPESKIANPVADNHFGEDYLGIDKDVLAFAKVISSHSFKPPLAIALFGKWGMGKSFFMEKLRVRIDEFSRFQEKSNYPTYCTGVAQIHFNAWSYMDANLWASIVTRIFEGLQNYINNDTKATKEKDAIEKKLSECLNVIREEREAIETQKKAFEEEIETLTSDKVEVERKLKTEIEKIEKATLYNLIKSVEEKIDLRKKVNEALSANPLLQDLGDELDHIVPEEYKSNPELAIQQLKSGRTFVRELIRDKNIKKHLIIGGIVMLLILIVPWALKEFTDYLKSGFILLPQIGLSAMAVIVPIWKGYQKVYDKLKPIISDLWKVKIEYDTAIENAHFSHRQKMEALELSIQSKTQEINHIDERVLDLNKQVNELDFKLEHRLATQTLYSFIEKRASSEEYKQHLGIVSTIRSDFEVLSELFDESIIENVSFRDNFDKPLQRIVLYIDDLDRCPEDRVIEVLEAVNLLMAFPLFVVVVGVDPRWVKNALMKKYQLQFGGTLNGEKLNELEPIEAANYLEKIFQIPFHLKQAEDNEIKGMLMSLTKNNVKLPEEDWDEPESVSVREAQSTEPSMGGTTIDNRVVSVNSDVEEIKMEEENLKLFQKEVEYMQELSEIIGNNPRAVKRFINVYQIVRAHEGLTMVNGIDNDDFLSIMLLLALPIGSYKDVHKEFIEYVEEKSIGSSTISKFWYDTHKIENNSFDDKQNIKLNERKKELHQIIRKMNITDEIIKLKCKNLSEHNNFIKRFTFSELY